MWDWNDLHNHEEMQHLAQEHERAIELIRRLVIDGQKIQEGRRDGAALGCISILTDDARDFLNLIGGVY